MANNNQSPNQGRQSVKIKAKPIKGPSSQATDFALESDVCVLAGDDKCADKKSNYQPSESPEILSTAELISAVGRMWDCASSSLSRFQPKARVNHSEPIIQKDSESCFFFGSDNFGMLDLAARCLHVDLKSSTYSPTIVQQSLERLRPVERRTYIPCSDYFIQALLLRSCHHNSIRDQFFSEDINPVLTQVLSSLGNSYRWMSHISQWPEFHLPSFCDSKKIIGFSFSRTAVSGCPASGTEVSLSGSSGTDNVGSSIDMHNDLSSGAVAEPLMNSRASVSTSYSEHCLQNVDNMLSAAKISDASSLELHGDDRVSIAANGCTSVLARKIEENSMLKNELQSGRLDTEAELHSERYSVANNPHPSVAKQEHAVSGAIAGIFVSLCLHPIDTVKTIVQSCRAGGQNSISFIGQSIISERGLSGLYRGITSNITTSAPISAIYTFTYESVKGFLLPCLSKEYQSVAHCTAGACASIATSFIFTPSERIKQQMQVNTQYRNCWSALFRIIEKGGLLSLYTGWGAVLCRNIPHSIIKFYTYESLKQMFMSSQQPPNTQPTTLQTLLCGGLAGSTAALVSTPFDVVKTRLQTQVPGSARRYNSILNALKEIRAHEGVKGLYRGLIPRFVMYMSQGALFFASYEFFKSAFSL